MTDIERLKANVGNPFRSDIEKRAFDSGIDVALDVAMNELRPNVEAALRKEAAVAEKDFEQRIFAAMDKWAVSRVGVLGNLVAKHVIQSGPLYSKLTAKSNKAQQASPITVADDLLKPNA